MTCEKFPPKCLHCELPGHVIDDCPRAETILCFNCQKYGHTQNKCPKLQKKRKSDTTEELVSADRLAEANKKTKIVHNGWLAKCGDLETRCGILEETIEKMESEKEVRDDIQARRTQSLVEDYAFVRNRAEVYERENEDLREQIKALKASKASVRESLRQIESQLDD